MRFHSPSNAFAAFIVACLMAGTTNAFAAGQTVVIAGKAVERGQSEQPAARVMVQVTAVGSAAGARRAHAVTSRTGLFDLVLETDATGGGRFYVSCEVPHRCRAVEVELSDTKSMIRAATLDMAIPVEPGLEAHAGLSDSEAIWHLAAIRETAVLDIVVGIEELEAVQERVRERSATVLHAMAVRPSSDQIRAILARARNQVSSGALLSFPRLQGHLAAISQDRIIALAMAREGSQPGLVGVADGPFDDGEVILVTGSTIPRIALDSLMPLTTYDKKQIDASGIVEVGDFLQDMPWQANAINGQFNNGGAGAIRVSLRGLGAARTLVLVNGRRHVPGGTGANLSVDLTAIPRAIIDRIEVLAGGASAVYGSGAVAGVVNIITRKNWSGFEASAYTGISGAGDGTLHDLSAIVGHAADKGSVMFAASYTDKQPVMERDWEYSREVLPSGSSAVPQGYIRDRLGLSGNDLWQQVINGTCQSGTCYNDPEIGWRDVGSGDFYNFMAHSYLITPLRRHSMFLDGRLRLSDHVTGIFEASYSNRRSSQQFAPTPISLMSENIAVSAENIYNPFGRDFIDIKRRTVEAGDRGYLQDVGTFRLVLGFEGKLPEELPRIGEWNWGAHYNYGRTRSTDTHIGNLIPSRLEAALGPSYVDEQGRFRCGTRENTGDPDCVPLNLFGGAGTITKEMLDYLGYTGMSRGLTELRSLRINTAGPLSRFPGGGDIKLSLGMEYLALKGEFIPDPQTLSGDTTGNPGRFTEGLYDRVEGYGELSVLPLVNVPRAKWLELNGAYRLSKSRLWSRDASWRVSSKWMIDDTWTLRVAYSRDFRLPSIGQYFTAPVTSTVEVRDPCVGALDLIRWENCMADGVPTEPVTDYGDDRTNIRSRLSPTPRLSSEDAQTIRLGVKVEPAFVPGLALEFTYFDIEMRQTIQFLNGQVFLDRCYSQVNRDQSACDAIERDPVTGQITEINVGPRDVTGGAGTSGVDFTVVYSHETPIGNFRHDMEGTRLSRYDELHFVAGQPELFSGVGVYDLGAFPRWRWNFSTLWQHKNMGAGLTLRYIGVFKECEDGDCRFALSDEAQQAAESGSEPNARDVSSMLLTDLSMNYVLDTTAGESKITLGVQNLMNSDPPFIATGFLANSDAATYNFYGRYFYARFEQRI